MSMRGALQVAEEDRMQQSSWTQRLGRELADARAGEQEAREQQAAQAAELREDSKRLAGWELARSRKRLLEVEEVRFKGSQTCDSTNIYILLLLVYKV